MLYKRNIKVIISKFGLFSNVREKNLPKIFFSIFGSYVQFKGKAFSPNRINRAFDRRRGIRLTFRFVGWISDPQLAHRIHRAFEVCAAQL